MAPCNQLTRRQSIPVLSVKGSYFEVGYDIGRTFGSIIHSYLDKSLEIQENLPIYETVEGKQAYDRLLKNVTKCYPQYMQELKGMAEGAKVPFYKLFLLQLGSVLTSVSADKTVTAKGQGCSTLCLNESGQEIIGHTEDALKDTLNHLYIVKVHITESESHEMYTALCYAGLLPGYAMGFNSYGLVFTINIIHAKHLNINGIPRSFIARALLTANNLPKMETILQCKGYGLADAMSVNFSFLNQKGDRLFHNIEVGPNYPLNNESAMSVLTISPGEKIFHCNKLLRLELPEDCTHHDSSIIRHKTMGSFSKVMNKTDLINLLGDTSHSVHNIFRDGDDEILTVAVGIFDLLNKTWSIYLDNPKTTEPLVVLPLEFTDKII